MVCLVTGGAGFIGSHIAEALVKRGQKVRIIDNLSTGSVNNITSFKNEVEFIDGDLADPKIAASALNGVTYVFHEAALPSVPRSLKSPLETQHSGELATLVLLDQAVKAGVKRVIFASSSSVYGDTPILPKVETMYPHPLSPYAASKLACEGYMSAYSSCHSIDTVSLRYFNVFGLRQNASSPYSGVIAKFIDYMFRGEAISVYGDGNQTRDFCYVENVVQANLLAMELEKDFCGEVFNIGRGDQISINQLIKTLGKILNVQSEPIYQPARSGDVKHSQADISKAKYILGYSPKYDFYAGLEAMCLLLKKL